jgi:SPP1 family predicted phage head-tail adaptor
MIAGPLDRRVTWQRATSTKDGLGADVPTWATVFETWCAKVATRGLEQVASADTIEEQTATLQLRWRPGLLPTDRVVFEGRNWRIQSLAELGRREGVEIIIRTRVDTLQVSG